MERKIEEKLVLKRQVKIFLSKVLCAIIIFLIGLILVKQNIKVKEFIEEEVYTKSFKFTKARNIYDKYFGKVLSLDKVVKEESSVFSEKLSYKDSKEYKNGVKLTVDEHYLVPVLESGIIVYVGEKDNLKTIIVEQVDGVDTYYSNVNTNNYKLYDYIEKGQVLGETASTELYLSFEKSGEKLDYKKYISNKSISIYFRSIRSFNRII